MSLDAVLVQENHFLGDFAIEHLPPMPKGGPQIEVTFDIDAAKLNVLLRDRGLPIYDWI